jgi:tyrosyl-tRNA synthetase
MDIERQVAILTDRCVDVVGVSELRERLRAGRPLRVKLGIDPSGPLLHLGHAVVLRKLREFQDLGHQAVLIVGDFTAQIGDPTGRSSARPPRSPEQIRSDMQSYAEQAAAIVDLRRTSIRYNSQWLAGLTFADLIRLAGAVTVARMLERDDFQNRYRSGSPIGLHEFLYPLGQAYDSVVVEADVELGGSEQLFNLLMGRRLQEAAGQPPQVCMTLPVLEGTDGVQRMGKSLNNYIALRDPPSDMFGKIMSIPDALIVRYFRLAAGLPADECQALERDLAAGTVSPRDLKLRLAGTIVTLYHGAAAASEAREWFERTVVRKELPEEAPAFVVEGDGVSLGELLVRLGWAASRREAQRLVAQGAIKIDGIPATDARHVEPSWDGKILQKGNRHFARLSQR